MTWHRRLNWGLILALALTAAFWIVLLWPRPVVSETPTRWSPAPSAGLHLIPTVLFGAGESDAIQRGAPESDGVTTTAPGRPLLPAGRTSTGERPRRTASPSSMPAHTLAELVFEGTVSHMGNTQGPGYLAIPKGPGWIVRLCGPGGCITRTSTDAGPSLAMQRAPFHRIADLYIGDFVAVCGVPASMGLCDATLTVLRRKP